MGIEERIERIGEAAGALEGIRSRINELSTRCQFDKKAFGQIDNEIEAILSALTTEQEILLEEDELLYEKELEDFHFLSDEDNKLFKHLASQAVIMRARNEIMQEYIEESRRFKKLNEQLEEVANELPEG